MVRMRMASSPPCQCISIACYSTKVNPVSGALFAGARMGRAIDRGKPRRVDPGVALGGGKGGMAQQLLDGAQVPAAGQQMGGKAVPERMGRGPVGQPEREAQLL